MTAPALLYLAGILLVFLVLHLVRGRQSDLWRRSVPRQLASKPSEAQRNDGETQPAASVPYKEEVVERDEREVVHHY